LSDHKIDDETAVSRHQSIGAKKTWSAPALVLEVFSIVLGVLLALGLSEWADDRQNQTLANSALLNIYREIGSNLETLKIIHENNVQTVDAIGRQPTPESDRSRSIIPGFQLRETAWEGLLATGLSGHVDYDTLLTLSQLYSIQRVYKQTGMQLSQSSMSATAYAAAIGTNVDDRHFQEQFIGYFQLLTQVEQQLLDMYQDALTRSLPVD